jgi:hypothetical protein
MNQITRIDRHTVTVCSQFLTLQKILRYLPRIVIVLRRNLTTKLMNFFHNRIFPHVITPIVQRVYISLQAQTQRLCIPSQ